MSAYGNDCHFYYNSTCTKGDSCAFRHAEAAKNCQVTCTFWQQGICSKPNCPYRHVELHKPPEAFQRNRQVIPCYWENQPVGCSRLNCQYQHFKPRPGAQNQPLVSAAELPDTSIPPPLFGQVPQVVVPIPGAPVIQPVVVHFSDSEVESDKNSPVKNRPTTAPVVTTSQLTGPQTSQTVVKPTAVNIPDLDYFIGKPFINKPIKSSSRSPGYYDSSSDRSYSRSRSPSPREGSISPRRRRSRSPSPRRSRSPRRKSPYLRDRSRSPRRWSPRHRSPSPRRRTPPRNEIIRPQDKYLQSRKPVHERLNRGKEYSPSRGPDKNRPPVSVSPKKISLSKIKDNTDSEDDKIKVKSLEEIQRAKALLSMGLIELKSGKIVKVGEVNKYKEEEEAGEDQKKEDASKKKKIIKKAVTKKMFEERKMKPKPKAKKVMEKVKKKENEDSKNEGNADKIVDEADEENTNVVDDLGEEPEIHILEATEEFEELDSEEHEESDEEVEENEEEGTDELESEPDTVQFTEDIRRAVRKEDVEAKTTPQLKRKRKVIVDGEEQKNTEKSKISIHNRLGRKLDSTPTEIKEHRPHISNTKIHIGVKSRLDMKKDINISDEKVDVSKSGTIKLSSGGIKSRLGIGSTVESDSVQSEPKKIVLKRTIQTSDQEDKKEVVKKRRWNTGTIKSRLGDSTIDTNLSDNDLKKIIITRNVSDEDISRGSNELLQKSNKQPESTSKGNKSQIKSTLSRINKIIENKRESQEQGGLDSGTRKKDLNKLSVWSSRVSESIAAVKPTKASSDIDLHDSSSNDSFSTKERNSTQETKQIKKGSKQERQLYVPPARKRTVMSYDEQEEMKVSPPKKTLKIEKEEKTEPETIKTYSQIMEEKRKKLEKQREKKAKVEEKSNKRKISRIAFSDKENENMSNEPQISSESKQLSPAKTENTMTKNNFLETFSFTLPDNTEKPSQSDKVVSSAEHMELLSSLVPSNSQKEMDDILEITPTKKNSEDNWLEFSKEDLDMTGCDTADDDDLLREIDELLA